MGLIKESDISRFWSKIEIDDNDCWNWTKYLNQYGYGQISFKGKHVLSHRFSYMLFKGDIDNQIDHLCRNRKCCNPDHLEDVTIQENIKRGIRPNKTYYVNGHKYTEKNTYICPRGKRNCRICVNNNTKKYTKKRNKIYE